MTGGAGGPRVATGGRGRQAARAAAALFGFAAATGSPAVAGDLAAPVRIEDNGIPDVLPGAVAGDPARGRAIVASRQVGLCLLCHSGPIPEERFQGDLAPSLAGAGDRSTVPQLRLRIADASRLNPETIMPSYYRVAGLNSVAAAFKGKPILQAQQIEDVVAYLQTLSVETSKVGSDQPASVMRASP